MGPADVVRRFGWLRSVGSANPYLAIHARTGASREEIERAVGSMELVEVPAARGCTYYVPQDEAGLALALARTGSGASEFRMAERHLGVSKVEVQGLADGIARALEGGPLDPRAISAAVAPRHLGEEGKRRGMTSTLSLGLTRLQLGGRIRRLPQGGRLDTERFRYALWEGGPRPEAMDDVEIAREVGRRYFAWAGPATEKEFREFAGLSAKLAKEGMVGLVADPIDSSRWATRTVSTPACSEGRVVLLSSLDPWLHLRRNLASLLNPDDAERRAPFGKSLADATSLRDLDSHPIVMDGAVVGFGSSTTRRRRSRRGLGDRARRWTRRCGKPASGSRGKWATFALSASTVRPRDKRGSNSCARCRKPTP